MAVLNPAEIVRVTHHCGEGLRPPPTVTMTVDVIFRTDDGLLDEQWQEPMTISARGVTLFVDLLRAQVKGSLRIVPEGGSTIVSYRFDLVLVEGRSSSISVSYRDAAQTPSPHAATSEVKLALWTFPGRGP